MDKLEVVLKFLECVITAGCGYAGVSIAQKTILKGKKMDIEAGKNEAVVECQKMHQGDMEKVKEEFNNRLDDMVSSEEKNKEELNVKLDEIKTETLKTTLIVSTMQAELQKSNNEARISKLEQIVAVLDNREKVSEHRLDDLEKR